MKAKVLQSVAAAIGLLLIACAHAQADPDFDAVWALAQQPGAVGAFASSVSTDSGTTVSTSTKGSGSVATASGTGGGLKATSRSEDGCLALSSSNDAKVCDGGNCCTVQSKVSKCDKYVTATAKINDAWGRCCVVLYKESNDSPPLFCGGPPAKEYYTFPLDVQVTMKPACNNVFKSPKMGSLSCSVYFPTIPKGFYITVEKPLVYNAASTFKPCMGSSYNRMTQTVSKANPKSITARCD